MPSPLRPRPKLVAANANAAIESDPKRRSSINQAELAYERLEELLVRCQLRPGRFLATSDLQAMVGLGRTPVHQAVMRFAEDTLMLVTPRHGIQIAPIDLTREQVLLDLRRDVERFVIRLATQRSGASQRNQLLHLKRQLVEHGAAMTVDQFNVVDRRIDQLLLAAANEPFVESTLRPLHTIFRRIGWIYHTQVGGNPDLSGTIEGHIAVIDAVAGGKMPQAIAASDHLMDFVDGMFDVLEREVPPDLLDCGVTNLDDTFMQPAKT